MIASGRYRSRFCIGRAAEVEWQHPVATAHGSVLRALRRLSGSIRSLPLPVLMRALLANRSFRTVNERPSPGRVCFYQQETPAFLLLGQRRRLLLKIWWHVACSNPE
jgi:hypothetical protein